MKDSRRRLVVLSLVYLVAVLGLLVPIGRTMVVEHEDWLRRSYTNRWAFRDVPTKRGGVRDRRGELLVFDRPTSALELHYREFRRRHPCGTALHAANLTLEARGAAPLAFSPAAVRAAFEICARLPFEFLRAQDRDRARDIRFYLASLVAALTDTSRYRVGLEIREAWNTGGRGPVAAQLGLEAVRLREVFERRLDELVELAALLQPDRDLWGELQTCEKKRRELPRSEHVARRLFDGLEYADARRIAQRGERHPGLHVRPSVARQRGAAEARWESLAPHVGHATAEWADAADRQRRAELLAEMMPELAAMAEANEDLPEQLRPSVTERLRGAMAMHMIAEGRVGRSGIELDQDAVLRGNAGMHWVLRGRRRRDIGLWSTFDVTPGDDVYLTVDLRLQHLLEQAVDAALQGRTDTRLAAIAIVDPRTGDVLALASRPNQEDRLAADPKIPDPAVRWSITGYIGSLAKPLVLAEHLDAKRRGRPHEDEQLFEPCRGGDEMEWRPGMRFRRHHLRCDHVHGTGVKNCVTSLGRSCNYFFFQVGEGLDWNGVRRAYDRFGLYRARGEGAAPSKWFQAHVPGIPAQSYPDPSWGGSNDIQRRSIGYYVEANVLQMARAYAGLATGRLPELSLVRRRPEDIRYVDLELHPDDLAVVREGMLHCATSGTAAELNLEGVWAKTGTAEISRRKIGPRRYRTTNNAWFAGFVGLAPAKLAFACVVYNTQQGGFGAKVAGPMFANFLRELRANPELVKDYL